MKEFSVEEKAKRYDSMFERLKEMYNNNKTNVAHRLIYERYFPELKESENERMIQYFKDLAPFDKADELYEKYGFSHKDAIAWLEKQGEHANFRNKIQIGDKVTRNEDGVLVNLSQLERVVKPRSIKPTDKIEPKFKVGDWVVYCNEDVDLITGIEENGYSINNGGYIPFICENEMRLWDITDAKVGDVLVSESTCGLGTWYCIFKSLDGDESMTVYCYLARDGRFETKKESCFDKDPYNTKPATKEQRNQLEKAMANAGYTFDFEKKELRKIEQKPAWSEEDEDKLKSILFHIEDVENKDVINWLKSLKDRVQPQLKQEWGEEDERNLNDAILFIETGTYSLDKDNLINWLKSFRSQKQWKPSDEQMDALHYVTNFDYGGHKATLVSLYNDLKRLLKI